MSRSSRSFGRRVAGLAITLPLLRFAYDNRDWVQGADFSSSVSFSSNDASASADANVKSTPWLDPAVVSSQKAKDIRATTIDALTDAHVDVLVIGGGATGLFAALDAASRVLPQQQQGEEGKRSLRVALVEQADFGSGSTGNSTTLLHSGFKRAQMAIRQRDIGQVTQLARDCSELRILEKISAPVSSSADDDDEEQKEASKIVRKMPVIVPSCSLTDAGEFASGSMLLFLCGLFGGLPTHLAYPIFPSSVCRRFSQHMASAEKDTLWCGFVTPERQMDGAALCRALARTAARHGATVANYCRVVGLDCAECPPRDPKAKFGSTHLSKGELHRRHLTSDGQPYPWFETAKESDFFMEEPTPRDQQREAKDDAAATESMPVAALEEGDDVSTAKGSRGMTMMGREEDASGTSAGPRFREEEQPFYAVDAVVVRDELSGKLFRIYPKFVINAAGAGSDGIRRMFPEKQKTLYERFSAQFHLIAQHRNPAAETNSKTRFGFLTPRNHIDAKCIFVFPFWHKASPSSPSSSDVASSSSSVGEEEEGKTARRKIWSHVGPVDAPIELNNERFYAPEKSVTTVDPATTSPSVFHELSLPRISLNDLSFIATGADIFGVNVETGFAHATPRAICDTWPGNHPPLARALRFGGSVDFRTMHQGIVHSVGSDVTWSRRKAEMMVDSFFIEQCRGVTNRKVDIPKAKTKTLALHPEQVVNVTSNSSSSSSSSGQEQEAQKASEQRVRRWARSDGGSATVLDVMLRRMAPQQGIVESVLHKKRRNEIIDLVARVLGEEWGWTAKRLESEKKAARSFFDRNSIASG